MTQSCIRNQRPQLEAKSRVNESRATGTGKDPHGRQKRGLWPGLASLQICWCSFYTQLEPLGWDQGRVLKKRLNQNRQGGRKLSPIYLSSQYVSWLKHPLCTEVVCRFPSKHHTLPASSVHTQPFYLTDQSPPSSSRWMSSFSELIAMHLLLRDLQFFSILYILFKIAFMAHLCSQ